MSEAQVQITPATAQDIPRLIELLRLLFTIEADFEIDTTRQQRGLEQILAAMNTNAGSAMIMVVRLITDNTSAGIVIAMASAQFVISTAEGARSAWIEDVVVHPDYRNAGIGAKLLNELLAWAKAHGAARAQLVIDKTNAPAELFYKKNGWETTQLEVRRRFL